MLFFIDKYLYEIFDTETNFILHYKDFRLHLKSSRYD